MPLSGIDVSVHQNLIDWTQVATANLNFAYARASLGITGQDKSFPTNWAGITSAGLFRGAYHVFYPDDDPTAQAQNFITILAAANGGSPVLTTGSLPAMVDVEIPLQTSSPLAFCNCLLSVLAEIALATGRSPFIYTNRSFWDTNTASSTAFAATYPLWLAEYGVSTPRTLPAGWTDYILWQYTQSLPAIPGTNTLLDGDYFNGALSDLQALAP